MAVYTSSTDIELALVQVANRLATDELVLLGYSNVPCRLEYLRDVRLLYISWDVSADKNTSVQKAGLSAALERIDSVTLEKDQIVIRGILEYTLNRRLTSEQTIIFAGTVGRVVKCTSFESTIVI